MAIMFSFICGFVSAIALSVVIAGISIEYDLDRLHELEEREHRDN